MEVYIFRTGIDQSNTEDEFEDRVVNVVNTSDEDWEDEKGHGTKGASVTGGDHHGMAKDATLCGVVIYQNDAPNAGTFFKALQ